LSSFGPLPCIALEVAPRRRAAKRRTGLRCEKEARRTLVDERRAREKEQHQQAKDRDRDRDKDGVAV